MTTAIEIPARFTKELRRLAKKHPAVLPEVKKLIKQLREDERPGVKLTGTGYNLYKVRLPNPSAQRGKSGGFRVIYYLMLTDRIIMVAVYSKSEQEDITSAQIRQILRNILPPDDGT